MTQLENIQELKRLSRRIIAARVIIFILAGLSLLIAVIGLVGGFYTGANDYSFAPVYSMGGTGLFYLILGAISITKPVVPFSIAAGINIFLLICTIATMGRITFDGLYIILTFLVLLLTQLLVVLFLIKGVTSARKSKKLLFISHEAPGISL